MPGPSALQRRADDLAGLVLHLLEVVGAPERLGVDLVDVLGARRPGREPGVLGGHLEAADPGAVSGCRRKPRRDRLPRKGTGADVTGGEGGELRLLLAVGRVVD